MGELGTPRLELQWRVLIGPNGPRKRDRDTKARVEWIPFDKQNRGVAAIQRHQTIAAEPTKRRPSSLCRTCLTTTPPASCPLFHRSSSALAHRARPLSARQTASVSSCCPSVGRDLLQQAQNTRRTGPPPRPSLRPSRITQPTARERKISSDCHLPLAPLPPLCCAHGPLDGT